MICIGICNFLGIYEDVQEPLDQPAPHSLRYATDNQPVGSFQPWIALSPRSGNDAGCVLGEGGSYYGAWSVDIDGAACGSWNESTLRRYRLLQDLEEPYFEVPNRDNFCRNPNLDSKGPWCYNSGRNSFGYCGIPDCLEWTAEFQK